MTMRTRREDWWRSVRERRDDLIIKLLKAKVPLAEFRRGILAQEKELLREAPTRAAALEIQRINAKTILTEAYTPGVTWAEFGPLLRRCQRLGFADITHEIHVACLFVQSLPCFPKKAREAFAMIEEVERKLRRIPKSHYLRREGMQAVTHARGIAEAAGIAPPAPLSRTRSMAAKKSGRLDGATRRRASRS